MSIRSLTGAAALGLAVAVSPGCALEREEDGVSLAEEQKDCPCTKPFELNVDTAKGGEVQCSGQNVVEFPEAATVDGLCADNRGFVFKVIVKGRTEFFAYAKDGQPVQVKFDAANDGQPPVTDSSFKVDDENGDEVEVTIP